MRRLLLFLVLLGLISLGCVKSNPQTWGTETTETGEYKSNVAMPGDDTDRWYVSHTTHTGACYLSNQGVYVEAWDFSGRQTYLAAYHVRGHPCSVDWWWSEDWTAVEVGGSHAPVYVVGPFLFFE